MSPQATRRSRKSDTKQDKPVSDAPEVEVKDNGKKGSKTARLAFVKETERTQQFKGADNGKPTLVKAAYITKDALGVLEDGQKQMDLTLKPFDGDQPTSAIRFKEHGKTTAFNRGDCYLVRSVAEAIGITEGSTVKLRLSLDGEGIKLVVIAVS